MTYFSARALSAFPFIEVYETGLRGENPQQYTLEPPPASAVRRVRFSPELNQMAAVYDLRIHEMPVIGNPGEQVPTEGIRVFSGDDVYLLFGGSANERPVMYRRAGPTYMRLDDILELPEPPRFFTHAAFTGDGMRLAVVTSDSQTLVNVYDRDEVGHFNHVATLAVPTGTLEAVEFSPEDAFLVVKTNTNHVLYDNSGTSFPVVTGLPDGRLLTISAGDQFFIVDTLNWADNLKAYEWNGSSFSLYGDVPTTQGTNRKATFNPNGDTLVVSLVTPTGTRMGPMSFFRHPENGFSLALLDNVDWDGMNDTVSFSRDGEMMYGFRGLYRREEELFYPHEQIMSFSIGYSQLGLRRTHGFSPDGTQYARIGPDQNVLSIMRWDGEQLTNLQTINYGNRMGDTFEWSPDGTYLAIFINGFSTNYPEYFQMWKWDASQQQYVKIPFPYTSLPTTWRTVRWTRDGNYLLVGDRVFSRNGDTFTFAYTGVNLNDDSISAICLTNDNRIIYHQSPNKYVSVGRYTATGFELLPNVPLPSWLESNPAHRPCGIAITSDDSRLVVTYEVGIYNEWRAYAIYSYDGNNYSLIASDDPDNPVGIYNRRIAISPDNAWLYAWDTTASQNDMHVYQLTDTGLKRVWVLPLGQSTAYNIKVPPQFLNGGQRVLFNDKLYEAKSTFVATSYRYKVYAPLWDDEKNDGFSPNGDIVHVTRVGQASGRHHRTSDMTTLDSLPFEEDHTANLVYDVQYSPKGTFVLWKNPAGLSMSVQRNDGGYIKVSKLDGTFVSVYNINRGAKTISEKAFANHPVGTEITDLVFSETPIAFSYFALNEEEDPSATQGRHIYNTAHQQLLEFKGNEFEEGMLASFLSFSPSEEYFAVTYRYDDAPSEIVLYKFIDGTLNYEIKDRKQVPFGPVDFSDCDKILVAHGGTEKPFTIYELDRDSDTLVERPYPPIDWRHEGFIVDVAFLDCDKFAVLTPDELITVEMPGDEGEAPQELDSVERDDGQDEDDDVNMDAPNDREVVITPQEPGDSDSNGHYDIGPGGEIIPQTYLPYVAVSVFYRE